MEGVMYRTQMF